ncbi:MAG: hypothetical protein HYT12_02360 [Candidatus Liptonbacteria bacterium]|nr:hypothetical protein [Candidatus Liptonbacteria bacterium]
MLLLIFLLLTSYFVYRQINFPKVPQVEAAYECVKILPVAPYRDKNSCYTGSSLKLLFTDGIFLGGKIQEEKDKDYFDFDNRDTKQFLLDMKYGGWVCSNLFTAI